VLTRTIFAISISVAIVLAIVKIVGGIIVLAVLWIVVFVNIVNLKLAQPVVDLGGSGLVVVVVVLRGDRRHDIEKPRKN
jgi:hypothetical protein